MKIAVITMLPGNPPLRHGKKEGRIPPPPTPHPTIHLSKIRLCCLYTILAGSGGREEPVEI